MITKINEFKKFKNEAIHTTEGIPTVEDLYTLFTKINNDVRSGGDFDPNEYEPLTSVDYYADQIYNLYFDHTGLADGNEDEYETIAQKLAEDLAAYATTKDGISEAMKKPAKFDKKFNDMIDGKKELTAQQKKIVKAVKDAENKTATTDDKKARKISKLFHKVIVDYPNDFAPHLKPSQWKELQRIIDDNNLLIDKPVKENVDVEYNLEKIANDDFIKSLGVSDEYDIDNDTTGDGSKITWISFYNEEWRNLSAEEVHALYTKVDKWFRGYCQTNDLDYEAVHVTDNELSLNVYTDNNYGYRESKTNESRFNDRRRTPRGWAILPAGTINLTTGDSTYFNIIENNLPDVGMFYLVKRENTFYVFSSSGELDERHTSKVGTVQMCHHDQNGREYDVQILGAYPSTAEGLAEAKAVAGKNIVKFSVFK